MPYGCPGKTFYYSKEVNEIKKLIDKVEKIDGITGAIEFGNYTKKLNKNDLEYIKLNEQLVDEIIHLASVSHQHTISKVYCTYFRDDGYNIKEKLDEFLESLNFYSMCDNSINYSLIKYAEKMLNFFEMGNKDIIKYSTYLADAYFDVGEERKANDIITDLINKHPNYDEPYQVMINWYMYKKEDIKKLENIVRKAKSNKHWLVSGSFVYEKILQHYKGNEEKYSKYEKLYKEWEEQVG